MSEPKLPFALTEPERQSPVWQKLLRRMEARIEALHRENENPELDTAQTALRRGQIKTFRELLRLGEVRKFHELPPGE